MKYKSKKHFYLFFNQEDFILEAAWAIKKKRVKLTHVHLIILK